MREILFKAKRADNGEWVTGYYIKSIVDGSVFGYIRESIFGQFSKTVDDDDKNAREELIKADAKYRLAENEAKAARGEDVDYDPYDTGLEAALDEDFYNAATYNPDSDFDIGNYL